MCGIFAILNARSNKSNKHYWRQQATKLSSRQKHRGPDASGLKHLKINSNVSDETKEIILAHERLSIVDPSDSGKQPLEQDNIVYIVNGEIYNYPKIINEYGLHEYNNLSDSYAIGILYNKLVDSQLLEQKTQLLEQKTQLLEQITPKLEHLMNKLTGMWVFVLYDKKRDIFIAARDHVGIIPMYIGNDKQGTIYISSELKAIHDVCDNECTILKPGHYVLNGVIQKKWYNPKWHDEEYIPTLECELDTLKNKLYEAVKDELMCDVPFGLLISGGLDSSLIAAITMQLVNQHKVDVNHKGMTEVHSFCIGLEGSPDLLASRKVAEYIGTKHHEIVFTVEEGLDAIPEVIYHVESYNPTTIRASTPMYLMAKKIKSLGIKMVLTGEGADEIFGGYLYFHKAPSKEELHKETVRKVKDLYKFDLLRANKSTMAWGLEVRPPFLHNEFLEYAMSLDPKSKWVQTTPKKIEKWQLRAAFDNMEKPIIPNEILWRQKEQFSDGVGYKWIDGIKQYAEDLVTDEDWMKRSELYPINTPTSKEMFLFRRIFESYFPSKQAILTVPYNLSIACSTAAALDWDESFKKNADESGRAILEVHTKPLLKKS